MDQNRRSKAGFENVRRDSAALFRRWSFSILPLGSTALLLAASWGQGSVHAPVPAKTALPVLPPAAHRFLSRNCFACHNKTTASGGLNLTAAPFRPDDAGNFDLWVKVYDRVAAGEMPPKAMPQPAPAARTTFLTALSQPLISISDARTRREGRSVWRRMNRYEYENTLRDLLDAPWLQIKEMLPEDGLAYRLNKVGEALDVSHVQMSRYLTAADYALQEAMGMQPARPETAKKRYYARTAIFRWTGASRDL